MTISPTALPLLHTDRPKAPVAHLLNDYLLNATRLITTLLSLIYYMTSRFAPDCCSKIRIPNYGQVWTASRVSSPGFCRPQNVLANCTLKHHMWHPASYAPIIPSRQPFWGLADVPRSAAFLGTSANITIGPTPWRRDGLEVVDSSRSIYYECLLDLQEA